MTGSDERDPLLTRELAKLAPIEHGADFWSLLDARLVESLQQDGRAIASAPTDSKDLPSEVMELRRFNSDQARQRPNRRGTARVLTGLAAAAVLVVVAWVGYSRLGSEETVRTEPIGHDQRLPERRDDTPSDGGQPSANAEQSRRGALVLDYQAPLDPQFVSDYSSDLIGFTPDGTGLLVIADHPGESTGSEGAPHLTVFVVPIDGGEPTIALPPAATVETGTYGGSFAIHPSGHVAWVESCDGYFCGLRTAKLAPDGRFSEVSDIEVPQVTGEDVWVSNIVLTADGTVYLINNSRLGIVEPGTNVVRLIDDREASGIVVLEDGDEPTILAVLDDEAVILGDPGSAIPGLGDYQAREMALVGDRLFVISLGLQENRFAIVGLESGEVGSIAGFEGDQGASSIVSSPNGEVAAVALSTETKLIDDEATVILDLGGGLDSVTGARFSSDGSAVAYLGSGQDQPSGLYIQRFGQVAANTEDAADAESTSASEPPGSPSEVEGNGLTEEVASFTTNFSCCEERVTNIALASELTHGTVIRSGESLSLNDLLGQRTVEAGFVAAGAIVDGTLERQVGGGISEYATTLFNSAFFAGLEFDEYQSHGLNISRYPQGRDATIGWPGPDLVIHNQTEYDVLIWNTVSETSITVALFSTKHIDVEAGSAIRSNQGDCTVFTTPRTRTYPDGTILEDSVFALYRPAEGAVC